MFETKVVEQINTHFMFNNILPPPQDRAVCGDNVEKYCTAGQATDGSTTRRTRTASGVKKLTNTHLEQVILTAFSSLCNNGRTKAPQFSLLFTLLLLSSHILTLIPSMSSHILSDVCQH